ncbi:phytochelatin synthase family protein [Niveibacterium sp.]|uniref:phytochelatin synthase family protein n=1 Tax=Niveibacterium sp. TaxID=2017444 RepID=UPI0035AFDAA5
MHLLHRLACATLASVAIALPAQADDSTARELLPFGSAAGMARLARASGTADFPALANQFEPQSNRAFCGPTTAAIVLNAIHSGHRDAPHDRRRLQPDDEKYLPAGFDLTVARYTQESVIGKGPKTRAQVLGEPMTIAGKVVQDGGYQLRQLEALLRGHGLSTRLVIASDAVSDAQIRADLADNLGRAGDYVIVNYRRDAVGQAGGAHISPLGAYDAASDSVLLMDVNPDSAGWVWMPLARLIQGMRTRDIVEHRGYILVQGEATTPAR